MLGGVVEPVISITDLAVVGNIGYDSLVGANDNIAAVAAVGIAGSLISTLVWIFAQMKSAISALVSQAFGANRMNSVATLIPQMLLFNIVVGTIAMYGTLLSSQWIFENVLSASGAVLTDATAYYNIRVFGFPLALITFSIFGVFRGIQNTWWAMVTAIIGGVVNVVLDLMLVLGWWDVFTPMGVEGAAYASVAAQLVMLIIALYFLIVHSKIRLAFSRKVNPQFGNLLLIAGNLVLRTLVLNIATLLSHKFANIYGTVEAATHAVVLNLWLFSAFFLDGFASSANAMAGKFLGARNREAMQRNLNRNLFLSLVVSFFLGTLLLLFDKPLMSLLINNNKVWDMYPLILTLFVICLPINAVAFTLDGIFKGVGKAKFLRNVLIISTFFGYLPTLFIGHYYQPGIRVIWLAIIAWMLLRAIIPYFYFKRWVKQLD